MNFSFVLSVLILYVSSTNVNGFWWGGGGGEGGWGGGGGGGWGGGGYGGYGGYGGWYGGDGGGGYGGNGGYSYTIVPEGANVVSNGPIISGTPGHSVVWSTRNVSPTGYVKCAGRYLRYGEICYYGKIYAEQVDTEVEKPKLPAHTVAHYVTRHVV